MQTRHDGHSFPNNGLPFYLHVNIERTSEYRYRMHNWHEEPEIILCMDGEGYVSTDGGQYRLTKGDIAVISGDVLHYVGTDSHLRYTCLIVESAFCRRMGIPFGESEFEPLIRDEELRTLFLALIGHYGTEHGRFRIAVLHRDLTALLAELAVRYTDPVLSKKEDPPDLTRIKEVIRYIREHYPERITLDGIARAVYTDKYALCRDFHRLTGQTVIEYLNAYRVAQAGTLLAEGVSVASAAAECGFENPSYFARVFRRHTGVLPSKYTGAAEG